MAMLCLGNTASAATYSEGAENGTSGVTLQTSAGYNPFSINVYADGPPHSFHFAHPDGAEQWMKLNPAITPQAGSVLSFKSRLAWAASGQTAHVQISTDAGATWSNVYNQAGTDGAGEPSLTERTVSLGGYAGQSIRIRFLYLRNPAMSAFQGTGDSGPYVFGWFLDQIQVLHPGVALPALSEGAENGTSEVTLQTSGVYNPFSTNVYADGPPHSFHFAHPDGADQWMKLNPAITPQAGSVLSFKSRLAWASSGQTAHVQVSTDAGATWSNVYNQAGTDGAGEASLTERTVSLGGYAGQSIRIRFLYLRNPAMSAFQGIADSGSYVFGWFVDQIFISNVTIDGDPVAPPTITQQPRNAMAMEGGAVAFSVSATGTGALTYQWHQNGTPIPGATTPTMSISSVQSYASGYYSVTASNGAGTTTSNSAALSVFALSSSSVTDRPSMVVRGTATNASNIAGIKVNGISALSTDGFNHWTVPSVSLAEGVNSLVISAISASPAAGTWSNVSTLEVFRATPSNLLPFAFNINAPLYSGGISSASTFDRVVQAGVEYMTFSYRRRIDPLGLSYLVEVSDDMMSWRQATVGDVETLIPSVANPDGITETVVLKLLPGVAGVGSSHRFTRVRVSLQ